MQYLLKISISGTQVWRLIAIDGRADIAHVARLMSLAFGYAPSGCSFTVNQKTVSAGDGGQITHIEQSVAFDSLNLKIGDDFIFKCVQNSSLEHKVHIMKAEERLYCLIPSCLVGSGQLPKGDNLDIKSINDYSDSEEERTLNLKSVTNSMRECGSLRADMDRSLDAFAKSQLNYVVKN
ncbi:MAG: hypothetical protein ACI4UM_07075 [Succinivibrio sp.]